MAFRTHYENYSKITTMSYTFSSFTALLSITCPNLCQSCLVIDNHLYTDLISTPSLFLSQSLLSIDNHFVPNFHFSHLSIELQQILIKLKLIFSLFQVIMNQVWNIHLHLHFPINFTGRIPLKTLKGAEKSEELYCIVASRSTSGLVTPHVTN